MRVAGTVLLSMLALTTSSGAAETTALPNCVDQLAGLIDRVGRPKAGEVASEVRELSRAWDRLNAESRRLQEEQEAIEEEEARIERGRWDIEHRLADVDRFLQSANIDAEDLARRIAIHNAEARQQRAAAAAARTPEAAASANGWGAQITTRKGLLDREVTAVLGRLRDLEGQRTELTQGSDVIGQASRFRIMHMNRERVDQDFNLAVGQCAALLPRALALGQIANAPARDIDYRAPSDIADAVIKDLGRNTVGAVAGIALEHGGAGRSARRAFFPVIRGLSRLGMTAARFKGAVTVAEIATEAMLAGADQNEREVVRNIYLIGDYAEALKVLFKERGAGATATPEYLAIRGELERLRDEMPQSEAEFLLNSADEPGALVAAFVGIAGRYAGATTTKFVGSKIAPYHPFVRGQIGTTTARALRQGNIAAVTVPTDIAVGTILKAGGDEAIAVANRIDHIGEQ